MAPLLLLMALMAARTEAKFQAGPVRISGPREENHWKYISKFGFGLGTGTYQARLKLHSPKTMRDDAKLRFEVFLDEDWPEVDAMKDVCGRMSRAKHWQDIEVPANGSWGEQVYGHLSQTMRPHIWYFALADCNNTLSNFSHRLKFEFTARQANGSEYSVELLGMREVCLLFLLIFTGFLCKFSIQTKAFSKTAGAVHPVIWTLCVSILLQYVAHLFHTIHLWAYSWDGNGVKALEVISEILFMLSQVTQTSLLILIALGYTLLQSKIGELDLMIPMCFMVGVIHIMLVGFGKIKDDASYKFHENEGVVGWILLALRLLLYVWFLWAVNSSAAEAGMKMRHFLRQYRFAGSVYFLSYPIIFVVTKMFAQYWQHFVMTVGLMAMQMGSNLWLARLFLTRGDYFQVSTLSNSCLPGGTKVGFVKDE